jgi:hypothetical protein
MLLSVLSALARLDVDPWLEAATLTKMVKDTVRLTLKRSRAAIRPPCRQPATSLQRHRFPPEVISHAVWLYFRFPLSLRMVEKCWRCAGFA